MNPEWEISVQEEPRPRVKHAARLKLAGGLNLAVWYDDRLKFVSISLPAMSEELRKEGFSAMVKAAPGFVLPILEEAIVELRQLVSDGCEYGPDRITDEDVVNQGAEARQLEDAATGAAKEEAARETTTKAEKEEADDDRTA